MTVELQEEARERAIGSIKRFVSEELDADVGDLKASLVLDYFLRELAPLVYNQAVADAARHLAARAEEMSGSVYEPEFAYWRK